LENEVVAVWGYDELVNQEGHFDDLAEMKQSAIDLFNLRNRANEG
jgi:hypothetical protein